MAGLPPGGVGAIPMTENTPVFETPQSAYRVTSTRTPTDARYKGDVARGGRALGIVSILTATAGIAAEIASILAAVSGTQQAIKLDWPRASGVWSWNKCEYLPNSDAPATTYGAGVILVLIGVIGFLVRFCIRPKANYGMGTVGFFMTWLGLRLMSKWVGTLQVAIGGAMALIGLLYLFSTFQTHVNILEPGLMDFQFGYNEFSKAIAKAYTAEDVVQKKKAPEPDQAAIQAEIDRQRGVYLTKTLAAYVPINPIAAGNGYGGGVGMGGGMGGGFGGGMGSYG
ncbi:MAG: hypothetical protein CYPHOPRED_000230 [Cyphobasidiales sp. Tagirdzhanova-0007]|nr:MAG: hypothetical protein CYPHOPRED_000230 [Cyphobasidiales sp. Tagirdzhanova-0007]